MNNSRKHILKVLMLQCNIDFSILPHKFSLLMGLTQKYIKKRVTFFMFNPSMPSGNYMNQLL
jgi:hypothetical protein